ncbi:MAG: hypothetical protein AAF089_12015 [Bacteroidota bacterium]
MGQQQVLLLVLTIIIIGLGTATAIDSFVENRRKSEVDIIIFDLVRLSSSAQAWKLKPVAMGGGLGEDGFTGAGRIFEQLGWETVTMEVTASNPDTPGFASRENTECYRSNDSTIFCPVPQFSGRRGEGSLVIYALGSLFESQGNSLSSASVEIVAVSYVSGIRPENVMIEVYR